MAAAARMVSRRSDLSGPWLDRFRQLGASESLQWSVIGYRVTVASLGPRSLRRSPRCRRYSVLLSRIEVGGGVVGVMEQQVDRRLTDAEISDGYATDLVRFAASIVGASDSEDVVDTALARLLSSAGWRSARNQEAYLYRAVLNAGRSHLRSQSRQGR